MPGLYGDGDGLWLRVQKSGSRNWIFIYRRGNARVEMGLGGYGQGTAPVSLALAREKAEGIRQQLARGEDPRAAKLARPKTFRDCVVGLIEAKQADWTGQHTRREWELHLLEYAVGLHDKHAASITIDDVKETILPYWKDQPSTGRRLLDRIKAAIDYGIAHKWRTSTNPAIWAGLLDKVMPKPATKKKHHAALGYGDLPAAMATLRATDTSVSRAVELIALTATRSAETREAVWSEVDLDGALWTIPAGRMKADKDHEIPLSDRAVAILRHQKTLAVNDLVFPGQREGKPIGEDAVMSALRAASPDKSVTLHGLRSSFRDWCGDMTDYPREVAEAALAHAVEDDVEAAYRRGTALQKRRTLMQMWADYCAPK